MRWFPGSRSAEVLPSPNIWYYQQAYEVENRAQDVEGEIWRVLREECDWAGRDVLDLGCGDGFHLPYFARDARSVLGVEPHAPLARDAAKRVAGLPGTEVRQGRAQRLPAEDASVDVVHARTAYFFGPGCEPGLREAERVLRPGGSILIVDLDVTSEPYGGWMRADLPHYDPAEVERFFEAQGFGCRRVAARWRFADAAAMESVLKIEFSAKTAERAIAEVRRLTVPIVTNPTTATAETGTYKQVGCSPCPPTSGRISNTGGGELTLPVGYRVHARIKPTGLVVPGHSADPEPSSSTVSSSTSPRIV